MEMNKVIRSLRYRAGLTQEQLATQLGVSPQSVSKWENAAAMPDISLLPAIAGVFGVSIDELFDLSAEQKLQRIESRMEMEAELPGELFWEYEEYLKAQLQENPDRLRILSLLGHLYHHRMESDAKKVSRYAREAILLAPDKKDCQWLLQMAEGHCAWDWNIANHSKAVDFYRGVIAGDKGEPKSPRPYYYLIDNLLADCRTEEAQRAVEECRKLPATKEVLMDLYEAHIALARCDAEQADAIMARCRERWGGNSDFLFESAQYHARKCEYTQAIADYEASYAAEEENKPRYVDALQGIAQIYEILGQPKKAAETWDRILQNMRDEWGFTEEAAVQDALEEKRRLLEKAK